MGLLRQLSDRQSDIRELLMGVRVEPDKTKEMGLAGNLGYSDDLIVAVVMTRLEMSDDPDRPVMIKDLIWAGEFLDHLDTQNYVITAKPESPARREPLPWTAIAYDEGDEAPN